MAKRILSCKNCPEFADICAALRWAYNFDNFSSASTILACKVAGKFDPEVAVNFDPPEPKSYPVWENANFGQEGGDDERQT
ncbi:MAG: hypothetical protein WC421_10020, partial [Elusimicrobiales bacterium]